MISLKYIHSEGLKALIDELSEETSLTKDISQEDKSFYKIFNDENLVGYVGLEGRGKNLLVRTLYIRPNFRRKGLAKPSLVAVEALAKINGAEFLHLLTTDKEKLFLSLNYITTPRESAPPEIVKTSQFSSICPAQAIYMVKQI